MSTHAKLSASGSRTWLHCAASPRISDGIPSTTSPYAEEGTRAHELAAELLATGRPDPESGAVGEYVDYVRGLHRPGTITLIEQRVDYSEWVADGYGTADAILLHDDGSCDVVDLKYGMGVPVDANGNSQLRIYGLGVLQEHMWTHGIDTIRLHIHQPRLEAVSVDELTSRALLEWGEWVKERAAATLDQYAPATPGAKQCRWCRASGICRARAIDALTVAGSDHLAPADIGAVLPLLDGVRQWAADIDRQAASALGSGQTVPGYKLVEGRSTRALTDTAAETLRAAGLGDDEIYRQSYRTLSDIERALGGKRKAAPVLGHCTTKPPGKATVVPESDPRPAIAGNVIETFEIGE